jgi:hypothetical protein
MRSVASAVAFLVCVWAGAGCLIAATTATIVAMRNNGEYTATARVPAAAERIYALVEQELEQRTDVEVTEREPDKGRLEATRGASTVRIKATPVGGGQSEVIVDADAGKEFEDSETLARMVLDALCRELQVECVYRD